MSTLYSAAVVVIGRDRENTHHGDAEKAAREQSEKKHQHFYHLNISIDRCRNIIRVSQHNIIEVISWRNIKEWCIAANI